MATTEKQEKERLRLIEHLSLSKMFAKRLHGSLVNADLWANDEQAPTVRALYEQAEKFHIQIAELLAVLTKNSEEQGS